MTGGAASGGAAQEGSGRLGEGSGPRPTGGAGCSTLAAAIAAASARYPLPAAPHPQLTYGTAGFRAAAHLLDSTLFRCGALTAARSAALRRRQWPPGQRALAAGGAVGLPPPGLLGDGGAATAAAASAAAAAVGGPHKDRGLVGSAAEPSPAPSASAWIKTWGPGPWCGLMVTASHNPEPDNGVKIVEPDGGMLAHAIGGATRVRVRVRV
jgi:hypothetical protein